MAGRNTDEIVLAVDPGAMSGHCLNDGKPREWGEIKLQRQESAELIRMVVTGAARKGCRVMLIEGPYPIKIPRKKGEKCPTCKRELEEGPDMGWRTQYGMGAARGRWEQAARIAGLRIEEVNPRTWEAATIGTGRRPQQIKKYQARARALTKSPKPIPPDASAAIIMSDWYIMRARIRNRTR